MHMAPAPLYLPEIARTEGLQLFVRALDGSTLSFQLPASAPVSVLLAAVEQRTGIPVREHRLSFGGKPLRADQALP